MHLERLRELRIEKMLTQSEVADHLCCQREVYRRYEVGTRPLPIRYLVKLSKLYVVSSDYILGLSNEK